jgi:hypothetical protein
MYYRHHSFTDHLLHKYGKKFGKFAIVAIVGMMGLCGLATFACVGSLALSLGWMPDVQLPSVELPSVELNVGATDTEPGSSDIELNVDQATLDQVGTLAESAIGTLGEAAAAEILGGD